MINTCSVETMQRSQRPTRFALEALLQGGNFAVSRIAFDTFDTVHGEKHEVGVNFVAFTKDSSLISIIGVTELFSAMRFSLSDPAWLGFVIEGYVFIGLIYFALCQFVIVWGRIVEGHLFPSVHRT